MTKELVRETLELYWEALAAEIASGERVDIPGISKVLVRSAMRKAKAI